MDWKKVLLTIIGMIIVIATLASAVSAGKVQYKIWSTGDSMWPLLPKEGSFMNVTTITPHDNLTIGDVYCYRANTLDFLITWNTYVCHQLVDLRNETAYFKGTNVLYLCDYYEFGWCGDRPVHRRYIAYHVVGGFLE